MKEESPTKSVESKNSVDPKRKKFFRYTPMTIEPMSISDSFKETLSFFRNISLSSKSSAKRNVETPSSERNDDLEKRESKIIEKLNLASLEQLELSPLSQVHPMSNCSREEDEGLSFKTTEKTAKNKLFSLDSESEEEDEEDEPSNPIQNSKSGLISDIFMKEHMAHIEIAPFTSREDAFKNHTSRDLDSRIDDFENA